MKHTDRELLDCMERHVTKVTGGDYVTFVVMVHAKRPSGTMRIAIQRAMWSVGCVRASTIVGQRFQR